MTMKILAVEDENIVALDIKYKLENIGYNVTTTSSSKGSIAKIEEVKPDLILMGLKNERESINTARRIKKHHDVPLIFLTCHSDKKNLRRLKSVGSSYIQKPFEDEEFKTKIKEAISIRK